MQLFYPYKIQNELLSSIHNINYQIFLRISLILYSIKRTDYSAGTFYIFLSGYHNSAKQNFIKKIHSQNLEKDGIKRRKVQVKKYGVCIKNSYTKYFLIDRIMMNLKQKTDIIKICQTIFSIKL